MTNPSAVHGTLSPTTGSRPALRLVPPAGDGEFDVFGSELDAVAAPESDLEVSFPYSPPLGESDERLVAAGLPVATAAGDDIPEAEDEDADPHEAAVVSIEVARLHRFLSEMDPLQSKVVRLRWGVFGERPHSWQAVANRVGVPPTTARRLHARGIDDLRCRFDAVASALL